MGLKAWAVRVLEQVKRTWVPVALVSGGGAFALSLIQGPTVNGILMLVIALLGLGVSTRTDIFHGLGALPGTRTVALTSVWIASALLYLLVLVPAAVLAGPGSWSFVGLGLFLQTVYLSAGVGFRRAPVWGAVAVTALTVAALTLVGMLWTGMNYAVAVGAQAPSWTDTLLWWGLAAVVPTGSLAAAWVSLGRK